MKEKSIFEAVACFVARSFGSSGLAAPAIFATAFLAFAALVSKDANAATVYSYVGND